MRMSDGVEWGVHVCVLLAVAARRRRAPRGQARRVPRRPRRVPRQAPPGAGRRGRAPHGQGREGRLPPGATRRPRSPCSRSSRRSTATSRRSAAARSAAGARLRDAGARVHEALRHPPRVQPGRRGLARRARRDDDRRSLHGRAAATCRAPRSKRAPAGCRRVRAAAVRSALAAGAGPLAVIRLVAAGLQAALLRLLAHRELQAS